MRKFSRIGATALALALSVTFLTPTTAMAAKSTKSSKASTTEELGKVGSDTLYVNEDVKVLGEYTGTGSSIGEASDNAELQVVNAGIPGGWLSATQTGDFIRKIYLWNGTNYTSYYYKDGIHISQEQTSVYGDATQSYKITVKQTTYVNPVTGKTSVKSSTDVYTNDNAAQQKFVSGIRIKTGETTYLEVPLKNGDTNITAVKSSKKKIVTATRFTKKDRVVESNDNIDVQTETVDGKTTNYYYTSTGDKVILGEDYSKDVNYLTKTNSRANVYIKLEAKKSGKSTLSFNIVNAQGAQTGSVKVTVYSMADTDVLKTFTFGGKSLLHDYSSSKNFWYGKKPGDTLYDVSTAKSGKLVVKANKTYKIVKIEVGKLFTEPLTSEKAAKEGYNYGYSYNASGTTVEGHKVDLNGDGDTDDTIGGIDESDVDFKYSTVKSGKKITLSTVGYDQSHTVEKTARANSDGTGYYYENEAKQAVKEKTTNNGYNLYAPTHIKITYYDTLGKTYGTVGRTIYRVVKK
ncbi:hypothetical protein [Butyrivibrio sp. VCD2006]|uniref:hypothetical protein n=1 Tax=Butyrivibrio sp. VCD2006 TaxID=1280664 RepID=UPI00041F2E50|nr:hypothetical protein [Butyrivibrio sp. VCD2006]